MLGAQLRLARQYAITQRRRVAVLMPSKDITKSDGELYNAWGSTKRGFLNPFLYGSFRTCFVDSNGVFDGWVPNSQWEYLPVGSAIFGADEDETGSSFVFNPSNLPSDDSGKTTFVSGVIFPVNNPIGDFDGNGTPDEDTDKIYNVRAVIFKPTGALTDSNGLVVTVGEGLYVNGNWIIRNGKNWQDLILNPYTGRLEYKGPQ
jgi:hypothetical protein